MDMQVMFRNPKTLKRVYVIVSGKVQRVHFRNFALEIAEDLNCTGYARNILNKQVELEVQGKESELVEFFEKLSVGRDKIAITGIEKYDLPVVCGEAEFKKEGTRRGEPNIPV